MATKTNTDVILSFYEKQPAKLKNIQSTGVKLFSYDTCIAQHYGKTGVIINITPYHSQLGTKNHVAEVKKLIANGHKKCIIYLSDVPIGTGDLINHFSFV